MSKRSDSKTLSMVLLALFGAIILLMAFTPFLGYIPLGFMKATTIHIPVIIGSIVLGPKKGAILGFIFGLTSLYTNTTSPGVTSFVFSPFYNIGETSGNLLSLVICFVPRILVGVVPFYIVRLFSKSKIPATIRYAVAGVCGSLTNTLLVMNMIYLFFGESYSAARGTSYDTLYSAISLIILTNGVPEAIVAAIITALVIKALKISGRIKI